MPRDVGTFPAQSLNDLKMPELEICTAFRFPQKSYSNLLLGLRETSLVRKSYFWLENSSTKSTSEPKL